jgi:hypothetical protein
MKPIYSSDNSDSNFPISVAIKDQLEYQSIHAKVTGGNNYRTR